MGHKLVIQKSIEKGANIIKGNSLNTFNWKIAKLVHKLMVSHKQQSYVNVKHQFMALKRGANLNGCHSLTVAQKYKSRYSLESRH